MYWLCRVGAWTDCGSSFHVPSIALCAWPAPEAAANARLSRYFFMGTPPGRLAPSLQFWHDGRIASVPSNPMTDNLLDPAFLDRNYNNRALVPEHPEHFRRWAADSAEAMRS